MGRLNDQAKKRIVELRKAGLSFRKIKKVLELDNIRVTPQAIYLFLKRKNVEPSPPPPPASRPLPPLEKGSQNTLMGQAGWEDDQLWKLLQENEVEHQNPRDGGCPAGVGPSNEMPPHCNDQQDSKGGIKIVSVTSLSIDGGQFGKQNAAQGGLAVGSQLGPSLGDNCPLPKASMSVSCSAPVLPAAPQPNTNGKGKVFLPPAKNPALIVKRKIVGRAIHLQKKANVQNGQTLCSSTPALPFMLRIPPTSHSSREMTPAVTASLGCSTQTKDAVTQTSTFNPMNSAAHQNAQWGGQTAPAASSQPLAEKLDTVHAELQKLAQAMHVVLERQCRLERQQEQQQRFQQEVLMTLQQLSSTISQGAVPANPPCAPYGNLADPSPPLPNFSQFKMELI
ncbi:uncharacterized protein LOC134410278 [Elgaria multicarinata webbii]|uniref:uncharacterized protein LOC134410278 n=1 Tax=Elgaria multicarinata webbii TaxID=159646 RepID=UPI002FCCCC7F